MNDLSTISGSTPRLLNSSTIKILGTHLAVFLFSFHMLTAQISIGGTPLSFSDDFQTQYGDIDLRTTKVPALNLRKVQKEDDVFGTMRFAAPVAVDFSMETHGQWLELPNGDLLWRMKLQAKGALAISALYDDFYLPPGAALFMYREDRKQVLGAYTFQNNKANRTFMTGFIPGETAVLEYYEPHAVRGQGRLHLFRVDQAYRNDFSGTSDYEFQVRNGGTGFGASLDCHVDINCPPAAPVTNQRRGVCRIVTVFKEGTGFCTGTLLHNTAEDGRPYILSAFHCQDGFTPMHEFWRFDFNYEAPDCLVPASEPAFQSVLGCTQRAGRQENDFLLVELSSFIPQYYNVYFNGWSRSETPPSGAYIIHHPVGDIKKLAQDIHPAIILPNPIEWNNGVTTPANHHFRAIYDLGTFELGSSGSALLDQNGRVVGQLHGGNASCEQTRGYFGRFSLSWEGGGTPETRLKDWLDPQGLAPMTVDGTDHPANLQLSGMITGQVRMENGQAIPGVTIELTGPLTQTTTTDSEGKFQFVNLPSNQTFGLRLSKEGDPGDGVSTLDVIRIQKHIINTELLTSPYKLLAADVNGSKTITTLDRIKLQKIILGIDPDFGSRPSWLFFPADFLFPAPADPFSIVFPDVYHITELNKDLIEIDFIGAKTGDVNDSANPGN